MNFDEDAKRCGRCHRRVPEGTLPCVFCALTASGMSDCDADAALGKMLVEQQSTRSGLAASSVKEILRDTLPKPKPKPKPGDLPELPFEGGRYVG